MLESYVFVRLLLYPFSSRNHTSPLYQNREVRGLMVFFDSRHTMADQKCIPSVIGSRVEILRVVAGSSVGLQTRLRSGPYGTVASIPSYRLQ
jgi:hypothetical protein